MQYILTESELSELVPRSQLNEAKEAIELFHAVFIGRQCIHHIGYTGASGYCDKCLIGGLKDREQRNKMCDKPKRYGK